MNATRSFRERIYEVVGQIPRGKVASYGLVALLAGRVGAARAVGAAMREIPRGLKLPCHRVIKSDGALAPVRVFRGNQERMLAAEGVLVEPNGRVDMKKYEWDGYEGGRRRKRGPVATPR
jgi:O-6-methylguanine DNA methyltransferase